jgi:hypothetical protein
MLLMLKLAIFIGGSGGSDRGDLPEKSLSMERWRDAAQLSRLYERG